MKDILARVVSVTCRRIRTPYLRWKRSASIQTALYHAVDMEYAYVASAYARGISKGSTANVMTPAAIGITILSVGVRKIWKEGQTPIHNKDHDFFLVTDIHHFL